MGNTYKYKTLPLAKLHELFYLDGDVLHYRGTGKEVKAVTSQGYVVAYVKREAWLAHRLVWALYHGDWPHGYIDHINGNKKDNRPSNLRVASVSLNAHNTTKPQGSTKTGVRGVSMAGSKYHARIMTAGKLRILGNFSTLEEASTAYNKAKREYLPEACLTQGAL